MFYYNYMFIAKVLLHCGIKILPKIIIYYLIHFRNLKKYISSFLILLYIIYYSTETPKF